MKKLEARQLFNSIYPFFLTFILARLVAQTDLIMASKISAEAVAAFAIPVRISIIDMIFAFSLAPVISVLVAEKSEHQQRIKIVQQCITVTLYLSLILTLIGLLLYPYLINVLVSDAKIKDLATNAVIWLTLSIPMRLGYFAVSMAIHGTGAGKYLPILGVFNLGLNFVLNYVFMYSFGFGFTGIYMATFISSIASLVYAMWVLHSKSKIPFKLVTLEKIWCVDFFKKQAAEFSRVASERVLTFVEIAILASAFTPALHSFSVGAEFLFLIYTPFLAVLRGTAIEISKNGYPDLQSKYNSIKEMTKNGFVVFLLIALIMIPFWKMLGSLLYNMPDSSLDWWKYIFVFGCLALPLKWVDSLQRASFQADKKISDLAKIDILIDWGVSIPLLYLGIKLSSPALAFSFFIIAPAMKIMAMHLIFGKRTKTAAITPIG